MWPEFWPWAVWKRQGSPLPQPESAKALSKRYHAETGKYGVPAWAWIRLAALGPFPPKPPVPFRQVPEAFQRYVFTGLLSNFSGDERLRAWGQGYRTILVQIGDQSEVAIANSEELRLRGDAYRAEHWRLVGWSATYTDPEYWAREAVQVVHEYGLEGYVTNWETWGEGEFIDLPTRFLREWQRAGSPVPIGLSCSSSDNDQWARAFNYKPWVDHGATIMPQVYGDLYPGFTVHNMLSVMALGGVPRELLAPTFGGVGPLDPYADYATWSGPHGVYIAGQIQDWGKL